MSMSRCPEPGELAQLADQTLDPERDRALLDHLATCSACRDRLDPTVEAEEVERWKVFWRGSPPVLSGDREDIASDRGPELLPEDFDGYEILRILGRGGMSVVYEARQAKLDRGVALKMLVGGAHASPRAVARLRAESATIAGLRHPGIVAIHDVGEHQGVPYLCLELVAGGSLADRLEGRPLPPPVAARLVAILARIVQHAHENGVIHRDLKPANVLVDHPIGTPPEQWERMRLTDFGLAKRLQDDHPGAATRTGDVLGTPGYMAPEQVMGWRGAIAPAVDVYGLGAILYELLAGRPPFRGESPYETAMLVVSRPPVLPRSFNRDIPPALESLCLRCLEKDPARRPRSAGEVADALEGCSRLKERHFGIRRGKLLVGLAVVALAVAGTWNSFGTRGGDAPSFRPRKLSDSEGTHRGLRFSGFIQRITAVEDADSLPEARFTLPGYTSKRPSETVISFDLSDELKGQSQNYLIERLKKNAQLFREPVHGIRYWSPVDDRDSAEIVYKFDFDFPIRSASVRASIDLASPDSQGELLVAKDLSGPWIHVCREDTLLRFPISEAVRESRTICLKAKIKGRNDGKGSYLAQFLRTSENPGFLDFRDKKVFELRASAKEVPFVRLEASVNGGGSWWVVWHEDDGRFQLENPFKNAGEYTVCWRAQVDNDPPVETKQTVWMTSSGCSLKFKLMEQPLSANQLVRSSWWVSAKSPGDWKGEIEFGDGTPPHELEIHGDEPVPVEHRYREPGSYSIWAKLRDRRGRMVAGGPIRMVIPPD